MKKVLILSASPRANGNSDLLAQKFAAGAIQAGNAVEIVALREKKIAYCTGCNYCQSHEGHCCLNDDAEGIIDKMIAADVLVFATPTYFYSMAGQLKVLIDRCTGKYTEIKNKEVYYLLSAWDTNEALLKKVVLALEGFTLDCLEDTKEKGTLIAGGVVEKGEVLKTDYPRQAYDMGKSL
jgi:multimeric flavodoxin WrbA